MNATKRDNCASDWCLPAKQGYNAMLWDQIDDVVARLKTQAN